MQVVTLKLERVFDVVRHPRPMQSPSNHKRTEFSFEAGGQRHFALQLPGWPRLESGMTVTAVLEQPGQWRTLAGWLDHADGAIAAPHGLLPALGAALALVAGLVLVPWDGWGYMAARLVAVGTAASLGLQAHRARRIRRLLQQRPAQGGRA